MLNRVFTNFLLLIFLQFPLLAQNLDNFPVEWLPTSTGQAKGVQIIEHNYYTIGYNEQHEQAAWVAYELTKQELFKAANRSNDFRSDHKVDTYSADLSDYKGSGYDRGHLAPAADMSFNSDAMSESFYLSNMSPQIAEFNRGIWKNLEEQFRVWAYDLKNMYIITGPILEDGLPTIGSNQVSVPKYYYKLALHVDEKNNTYEGICFIIPNKGSSTPLKEYIVTIDALEEMTGMNFFSAVADSIEDKFEGNVNYSYWPFYSERKKNYSTKKASKDHSTKNNIVLDGRCHGKTKSGSRCKRKTNDSSGYCWQHQDQAKQ
ncbi:DNA/RNA non-specific endonuclease [Flammeovirga sp. MY04]|uniref:DNA/RNA non-specific endonuclease n=1 Tax=Flammeovirga sp. MY04 TaxID=1191459 RepID=UPI00080623B5|nr:DNA/RNA non-specific endonuclease [Flammeovirga sp. MY04]ANQ48195.1 DNA/RNA non-specific endonuclease [Flammeovirga sp. MY04]